MDISKRIARPLVGIGLAAAIMSCSPKQFPDGDGLRSEITDSLTLLSTTADFNGFGVAIVGP